MPEPGERIVDSAIPDDKTLADWMGDDGWQRWGQVTDFINTNYPGVFEPEWLYGGKKHGWGLRYKKSRSFCTLIPERGRMAVMIVFGAEERAKAEAILPELVSHAREDYTNATTYHDGKWLALAVDSDDVLSDVKRLLRIKRKPKRAD